MVKNNILIEFPIKCFIKNFVWLILSSSLFAQAESLKETQQHITALKRNITMLEQLMHKSSNFKDFNGQPQTSSLLEDTQKRFQQISKKSG